MSRLGARASVVASLSLPVLPVVVQTMSFGVHGERPSRKRCAVRCRPYGSWAGVFGCGSSAGKMARCATLRTAKRFASVATRQPSVGSLQPHKHNHLPHILAVASPQYQEPLLKDGGEAAHRLLPSRSGHWRSGAASHRRRGWAAEPRPQSYHLYFVLRSEPLLR